MGEPHRHAPVLLLLAAFSRHDAALDWALRRAVECWGPIALRSDRFDFLETRYYESAMGPDLKKVLVVFSELMDPADLPRFKLQSNHWEQQYAAESGMAEPRPLNLDPGYLTEAKLVLASTKDRDHRIYLAEGVFAENTLFYRGGAWQSRPWTYPDYQRADYHQFLERCREYYRQRKGEWESSRGPDRG
jgi:hypothetical protein